MITTIHDIQNNWLFLVALTIVGIYPITSAAIWVVTAVLYRRRWEKEPLSAGGLPEHPPLVSIIIPAYCEEKGIARTIRGALGIDYPNKEIIVVDDGSTDRTSAECAPYVASGKVRLLRKLRNEGKAMACNDALPITSGEFVLVMDADAYPDRDLLRNMVPHLTRWARVAVVTGNPRVANTATVLSKIQALEFSSTVSLIRRTQRVWGRIMTISGIIGLFRRDALIDAGLYSPDMATEDIDMTWKLQRRFYDVRYEPNAIVWMQVPSTLKVLYAQRRRWALGMAQVLRKHRDIFRDWRCKRLYTVYAEAVASIIWAVCFVSLSLLFVMSYVVDPPPVGADPVPAMWGLIMAIACLLQLFVGVWVDRRYDPDVLKNYIVAPLIPLIYWLFLTGTTMLNAPRGLFGRKKQVTIWNIQRE